MTVSDTTDSPCPCCTGPGGGNVQCRSKGGTAVLIGYNEFEDSANGIVASVPPKKFRKYTGSGSTSAEYQYYSNIVGGTCSMRGANVIADNGQETQGLIVQVDTYFYDGIKQEIISRDSTTYRPGGSGWACQYAAAMWTFASVECTVASTTSKKGKPIPGISANGELVDTLSSEDTDEAARSREEAKMRWSEPGTCGAAAFVEKRAAGRFDFSFVSVQVRAIVPNVKGKTFEARIHCVTHIGGQGGAVYAYHDLVVSHTVGYSGDVYTDWINVPCPEGETELLLTYVEYCTITEQK